MSRDDPQMKLRLPPELKRKVEVAAKMNNRSLNSEIISRLEQSFIFEVDLEGPIEFMESIDAKRALESFARVVALKTLRAAGLPVNEQNKIEDEAS